MSLEKNIERLSSKKQIELAIFFLETALPIWKDFCKTNELEYTDSVVGTQHVVNKEIVKDTINLAKDFSDDNSGFLKLFRKRKTIKQLQREFSDPVISLQDLDFNLPKDPELVFYSAYNLTESLAGKTKTSFGDLTIYVSINQSIDAILRNNLLSAEEIKNVIKKTQGNSG